MQEQDQTQLDLRTRFLAASTKLTTHLHVDDEFGPMVFQRPGFKSALKIDDMDALERIMFLLTACLFSPVIGKDGEPLIGKDGEPLAGPPVFDAKADAEMLHETDWPDDSWFVRVVKALGDWIKDSTEGDELGKPPANASKPPE